jgi:uncharacterized membrane protein
MKNSKSMQFVINTVIAGALFLVPLVALFLILVEVTEFMMVIAEPLAEWIPVESISDIALANILAGLVVLLLCFLVGLIARQALAGKFVEKLESKILMKVPGYSMVKGMTSGFGKNKSKYFRPVAISQGSAERIGFEVEKLSDDRSTIYIPSTPSPWSGITMVLPADEVTYLDVPVTKLIEVTENYGHGMEEILASKVIA